MYSLLLLILALLPGFLLLYFILFMDRNEREPLSLVIKIMVLGAFSVVPAALIESLLQLLPIYGGGKLLNAATTSFVQAALVEELAKLAVVIFFAYGNKHFNEENDGIVYVGASALGFAMLENVLFVMSQGFIVGIMRSFTAVPLHCFSGVLMGYYVGRAKFSDSPKQEKKNIFKGFFLAFLLHGVYNTLLLTRTPAALLIFPLVIGLIIFAVRIMKKSRARLPVKTAEADAEAEALAQQREFLQAHPDKQRWKIIISRTLFTISGLFWLLLMLGIFSNIEQFKSRIFDAILGGIILSFLPIFIGIMLEVSYRRRRAIYNAKKEIYKDIPVTTPEEELSPPGCLWQVVTARILLILSGLFWTILVLALLAKKGDYSFRVVEVIIGGAFISLLPVYLGVVLEVTYRKKKKRFNGLLKSKPESEISAEDLRLIPPGLLRIAAASRVLLISSILFWLLFLFEVVNKSERVVSDLPGDLPAALLITIPLIFFGVLLEVLYRRNLRAFRLAQQQEPAIPPALDPRIPAKSDEELSEYSRKLKNGRDKDRFYYKKRE